MKKHFLQFIAITGLLFFTACSDSASTETNKNETTTETKSTIVEKDSTKKTTISIGPEGAGVNSKNTEVEVNKSGVKVGTKDVKVDVKSGK